jgi:hypothetical protein
LILVPVLIAIPVFAFLLGINLAWVVILSLTCLFILLFALLVRWASKSLPRAIIFVALLCAAPVIAVAGLAFTAGGVAFIVAVLEGQQPQHIQKADRR